MYIYYVYAYLRKDGTPYYIGKGKNNRAYEDHITHKPPKYKSRIVFLERNLSEIGALALERRYIKWYGRKDLSTGILRNETDGGDGISGYKHSDKTRFQISHTLKGKPSKLKGIPLSIETRRKMASSKLGVARSEKTCARISAANKGKPKSEETRAKMSASKKGRQSEKKGITQEKVVCPHCSKEGGITGMKRYHFNNCLSKDHCFT